MPRILVVEDKASLRELMRRVLAGEGFEVTASEDAEKAAGLLGEGAFDVLVTDLKLPGADGHWLLGEAKRLDPRMEVVVLTAFGSIESSVRAVKAGAFDYLTKPVENDHLTAVVRMALSQRERNLGGGDGRSPVLLGESPAFREALALAEKAAQSDATILLLGESGTGKELFARFIHRRSKRSSKPFVSLNCGALAPALFESELFGHERGAFTGAVERKIGRFEAAGAGTLFLDEVSEIPLDSQVKLLRVLQEREFERVGGLQPLRTEARVLAATNRSLAEAVKQGRFREDLFYRLNVIPLTVPTLRERPGDIDVLAKAFLEKASRESGKAVTLSPGAWDALRAHAWPGNVRELEHCIQRAVILGSEEVLATEDLALPVGDGSGEQPGAVSATLKETASSAQAEAERRAIAEALKETRGNKSEAARRLRVGYKTLLTKIKDLGIDLPASGDN